MLEHRVRRCCYAVALTVASVVVAAQPSPNADLFRVVLLGTGAPPPLMNRFGPSILVDAGPERLLFDAGRGAMQRLDQIDERDCDALFLTHLHSDHVVGIPDVYLTGWLTRRRTVPFRVWGPQGTVAMMNHLRDAFTVDIGFRVSDDGRSPAGAALDVRDISEGVVYSSHDVTVSAFEVDHRPVKPAFGYRIEYHGHAVVLSGDTRASDNLVGHAKGADLLIHEVGANADPSQTQANNPILAHHTTPEQAGTVFNRVAPKLAVYCHFAVGEVSDAIILARTRTVYQGPLIIGADLMAFDVGNSIAVHLVTPRR